MSEPGSETMEFDQRGPRKPPDSGQSLGESKPSGTVHPPPEARDHDDGSPVGSAKRNVKKPDQKTS